MYVKVPVRRGHTEEMIDVLKLLSGPLEDQNREKARELGIVEEQWWLRGEADGDVLYVRLIAEEDRDVIAAFEESATPIAIWLRSKLKTHTCYDPERLEQLQELPDEAELDLVATWSAHGERPREARS